MSAEVVWLVPEYPTRSERPTDPSEFSNRWSASLYPPVTRMSMVESIVGKFTHRQIVYADWPSIDADRAMRVSAPSPVATTSKATGYVSLYSRMTPTHCASLDIVSEPFAPRRCNLTQTRSPVATLSRLLIVMLAV